MYWHEENNEEHFAVPDNVMDLQFQIHCPTLPVDHASILSSAIQQTLPWISNEPLAGLHIIHGADSGNGWERPNDLLNLSRRTRLTLRLPKHRIEDAKALSGQTLDIAGHKLEIQDAKQRLLSKTSILYSRYVVTDPEWDEDRFIQWAVGELKSMRLRFKKILCGRSCELATDNDPLPTRSLMVADLSYEDAVYLQEQGLGPGRTMGCGLFIPQKSF